MRQMFTIVRAGEADRAKALAKKAGGINLLSFETSSSNKKEELVLIQSANQDVDAVIDALQGEFKDLKLTLIPRGIITLTPPKTEVQDQISDVTSLAPLEVFLAGLQSIGSWRGFLSYAVAAGVVVWVGLYTNTVYLLIAAMLIAPFAGPAMTLAIGTARGDRKLIGQSLLRYASSISTAIGVAALLSFVFDQGVATSLMINISKVSAIAALLPLTAGAAGALVLCKSERDSLVTAAGPGMLVAASLAPPAGVIGMAASFGQWQMVKTASFLLLLQLVVINLSGSIVFSIFGLKPKGVRYARGDGKIRIISTVMSVFALTGLLFWQFSTEPVLQRSSLSRKIRGDTQSLVQNSGLAKSVEISARFTRDELDQHTMVLDVYVLRPENSKLGDEELKSKLAGLIQKKISSKHRSVAPLVNVVILKKEGGP